MKKVFFAICAAMPGGVILSVTMFLFVGCARFQYQVQGKFQMQGRTTSPETVALSLAEFGRVEAESKCIAERGMATCYYGGYGFAPPEEQAFKQFLASQRSTQQQGTQTNQQQNDLRDINKNLVQIKNSQKLLIEAIESR